MKRVLTIQDISCIGKCSLTVALPILSSMGLEAAIVPTALLSAHTQFSGVHFRDLTDDLEPIRAHWEREGLRFEAIYTGYLGSRKQIALVKEYFRTFAGCKAQASEAGGTSGPGETPSGRAVRIVDPVMADGGRLYAGFDDAFVREMRGLCREADIILPNLSEAALLTGEPYPGEDASEEEIRKLLTSLSDFGCRFAVITGVTLGGGTFGFAGYDRETRSFFHYGNEKVPYKSHGTGDIFASTFTGALIRGSEHPAPDRELAGAAPGDPAGGAEALSAGRVLDALRIAADYTCACIRNTCEDPERVPYGVNFEAELPYLMKRIGICPESP